MLDAYADGGGNFLDTADSYTRWVEGSSGGESETIIGRWMAARGNRDQIVVATKVGKLPARRGLAPATIRAAADESLAPPGHRPHRPLLRARGRPRHADRARRWRRSAS